MNYRTFPCVLFLLCFSASIWLSADWASAGIFRRAAGDGCTACPNGQCAIPPAPASTNEIVVPAAPETCAAPAACAPAVKHAAAEGRRRPIVRLAAGVGKIGKKAFKAAAAPIRLLRRR